VVTARWLLLAGLLVCQAATAVNVTTHVDRNSVQSGQPVVVTWEVDEPVPAPDFSPLLDDFDIVDRSESRSVSVSGGKPSYRLAWTLTLLPRREGALRLPPVDFGGRLSEPHTITVNPPLSASGDDGGLRVEVEVDDATPYANQQVLVTVQAFAGPEVEDLSLDAPRVIQGRGSIDRLGGARQYESVRGGRPTLVREQRYTLVPAAAGELVLSGVMARGRQDGEVVDGGSAPLRLEVLSAAGSDAAPDPDELFMEVAVDEQAPWVQEQVLYTVRLFHSVVLENARLDGPRVSGGDAVIERAGRDRGYQETRDGRRYSVVERRFAIFPQSSGRLTIEPMVLKAEVPLPAADSGNDRFWNRPLTQSIERRSAPVALAVEPKPDHAPGPWLPARNLTLQEEWPEPGPVEIGAPVTRRVTLTAQGLLASQLPEPALPVPDAVRAYPERPARDGATDRDGAVARLTQSVALIPSQSGSVTIPAYQLQWWDTDDDELRTLELPERVIEVSAASQPAPADQAAPPPAPDGGTAPTGMPWRWIAAGVAIAWLATLVFWALERKRRRGGHTAVPESPVPVDRRAAGRRLRQACRRGDPEAARDAVLEWDRARRRPGPLRSLDVTAAACRPAAAAQIGALQRALYARDGGTWDGEALYRALMAEADAEADRAPGVLKPLYDH